MMATVRTIFAGLCLSLVHAGAACAEPDSPDSRLSGPLVHGNLAIYLVHGGSRAGPVPLSLQEALAKNVVKVHETRQVNELKVENTGDEEVFIQSGDIVKGGQQDRVLGVSLLLPPHSGEVPIASFCVESGRWSAREREDARLFSSADASLPSRTAKLEMAGALAPPFPARDGPGSRQQQIWKSVAQIQQKLSASLGRSVASPRSQTSLQLTLENDGLARMQAEFVAALEPAGNQEDDILGYVAAVNGKVTGADIYPSNGLFRKMWPKLLRASITEAIGERDAVSASPPPSTDILGFINAADSAHPVEADAGDKARIRMRESSKAMLLEARPATAPAASWVHRSYLAK